MFEGSIIFLDRDNINTDEIIPAKYLTEIYKQNLKPHLFEDLDLPACSPEEIDSAQVAVTRDNFGCGSSREHAPWALQVNGITAVAASGFARIFRQNMFNCGLLPAELNPEQIDEIFSLFAGSAAEAVCDIQKGTVTVEGSGKSKTYEFSLSGFHRGLLAAGGWVEYAAERY